MKASSQAAGWKGMLIKHGEKGVLGIIGVLVLLMMYSGLKKEGLKDDQSPDKLLGRVKNGEEYIATAVKIKPENGGEKFVLNPYDKWMVTGIDKLKVEEWPLNIDTIEFPKIAKRSQPAVFPAEEVHATALVVQVALNDEKAVKQQIGIIQNRNDVKQREEAKKLAAAAAKKQAEDAKEAKRKAIADSGKNSGKRGGGEGGGKRNNPLAPQPAFPPLGQPAAPAQVEVRAQHPAVHNQMGITSATKGIAVVTALIPYKKQIQVFNQSLVEGRDIIPGRKLEDDSPLIATFKVERAQVVNPNDPADKLQWVDITPQAQEFFVQNGKQLTRADDPVVLSLHGPDTVGIPKKGIPGWYTVSPLPSLADRKWQREVTHPRIPLITDLTEEEIKVEEANAFMPVAPAAAGGFGQPAPVAPVEPVEHELPEYVLLRHIDFNVVPGANYRYRVTLAYQNPNLGLDSKYLDTGVVMTDVLPTTPSKPSNTVTLPPLHQVLAGGDLNYPPPKRIDGVPSSRVWQWLIDIDKLRGGEVAKDFPNIAVGDLLELTGTIKNILNRPAGVAEEIPDYNFAQHRIPRGTQMTYLVDVFGKEAPPAPKQRPVPPGAAPAVAPPPAPEPPREQPYSEILFVDQDGKLRSSSSTYAETLIDNYKLRYESTQPTTNAPGVNPGLAPPQPMGGLFGAGLPGKAQKNR